MLTGALRSKKGERGMGVVERRPCWDHRCQVEGDHGRRGGRGRGVLVFEMLMMLILLMCYYYSYSYGLVGVSTMMSKPYTEEISSFIVLSLPIVAARAAPFPAVP